MCSSDCTFSITSSTLSLSPLKPSFQRSTKCHFRTSSLTESNGYVCISSTYCPSLTHTPQLLDSLKTWTRPIHELQRIIKVAQPSAQVKSRAVIDAGSQSDDTILSGPASAAALSATHDVQSMARVFKHTTGIKLFDILTHAELLGLAVSWFSQVCILSLFLQNCISPFP